MKEIPATGVTITPEDKLALIQTVMRGWYTDHVECAKFRRSLSEVLKREYIVLTNSGSSASLLAVTAMNTLSREMFPDRNIVITTACSFPTTVSPIYQNGLIPYYIDIEPDTLAPKWEDLEYVMEKHGEEVAAIVLTHTLGFPFDDSKLAGYDPFIIIDACDSLGARVHGVPVGVYADFVTHSFFPAHHITTGEGGAVTVTSEEYETLLRQLSEWARDCHCKPGQSNTCGKRFEYEWKHLPKGWDHKYTFTRLGYNLKMTDLQASLGNSQLQRLDEIIFMRQAHCDAFVDDLRPYLGFIAFVHIPEWSEPSPFGFPIRVRPDAPFSLNELVKHLEDSGVKTRRFFGGNLTRQPGFENLPYYRTDLSGSDVVMEKMCWIGCQESLTWDMLDYVIEVFDKFFEKYK